MSNPSPQRSPDTSKVAADAVEISTPFYLGGLAPYQVEKTEHETCVRVFWGRVAVWSILMVVIGWLSLAGGIYAFVKYRRGFTEVRFAHILALPLGGEEYRRAKGEFLIRQGLAKAEAQEWRAAFSSLRAGLVNVPEHREGRLLVARIYLMAGRSDAASQVLLTGLDSHGDELDYLRTVLGFFFGLQADNTVIEFTTALGERLQPGTPVFRMAHTARAYALFNRGRHAEALNVLRDNGLLDSPEGRFVAARVDWARGEREVALERLRELSRHVPEDSEIHRTLVHYLGEEGLWNEVRRVSVLRQLTFPDQPEAYLDEINACRRQGDEPARRRAEEGYLAHFADNAAALLRLAEQSAAHGDASLVGRLVERCGELGQRQLEIGLVWVAALLESGDYAGADALAVRLGESAADWSAVNLTVLNGLRAVALYGLRQPLAAEPLARRLSEAKGLPAAVLTLLAGRLERVGQPDEARRVLRHAVEVDSLYQPALANLLRLMLEAGQIEDTPPLLARLLDMRSPPEPLLESFWDAVRSDRYLFWPEHAAVQSQLEEHRRGLERVRSG